MTQNLKSRQSQPDTFKLQTLNKITSVIIPFASLELSSPRASSPCFQAIPGLLPQARGSRCLSERSALLPDPDMAGTSLSLETQMSPLQEDLPPIPIRSNDLTYTFSLTHFILPTLITVLS